MTTPSKKLDVVGLRDIARILQVEAKTPTQWRKRSQLPEEDGMISGTVPIWHRSTILKWAAENGKLPTQRQAKADGQDAPEAAAATA